MTKRQAHRIPALDKKHNPTTRKPVDWGMLKALMPQEIDRLLEKRIGAKRL